MRRQARLILLGGMTAVIFLLELVIGYVSGSIALVSDSFHMLSDLLTLWIAWYAMNLAAKSGHIPGYTYGYQRAEILGALMNGVFLVALCFTIIIEAIQRIVEPVHINNPVLVLAVGSIGLVFNLLGMALFHEHAHAHSHGGGSNHDHGHNHGHFKEGVDSLPHGHGHTNDDDSDVESLHDSGTPGDIPTPTLMYSAHQRAVIIAAAESLGEIKMMRSPSLRSTLSSPVRDGVTDGHDHVEDIHGHGHGLAKGTSMQRSLHRIRLGRQSTMASNDSVHDRESNRCPEDKNIEGSQDHDHSCSHGDGHIHSSDKPLAEIHEHSHGPPSGASASPEIMHLHGGSGHRAHGDHGDCHSHGSSHGGHDIEVGQGKGRHTDLNLHGVFLHVLGDALGSVGVIISALIVMFADGEWRFYSDAFISLFITAIILSSTIPLIRSASFILLQGAPSSVPIDRLKSEILKIPGILDVHELHVWALSNSKAIASVHILVSDPHKSVAELVKPLSDSNHNAVSHTASQPTSSQLVAVDYMHIAGDVKRLMHKYGVHSTTVQPEFVQHSQRGDDGDETSAGGAGVVGAGLLSSHGDDHSTEYDCLLRCAETCDEERCCAPPPRKEAVASKPSDGGFIVSRRG